MEDPKELCCPISHELMEDPVVAADGQTYERAAVEEYFKRTPGKSPMGGQRIESTVLRQAHVTCEDWAIGASHGF